MKNLKNLITLVTLATSSTGCIVGEDGVGTSDEEILGGAADTTNRSVVQIRYNVNAFAVAQCTGTVISSTSILTAAHCANGFNYQYNASDTADWTNPYSPGWIPASYAVANPSYNGNPGYGHDVAVLKLGIPTTLPPMTLGTAPAVGSGVLAVGYGLVNFGTSGGSGTRNNVWITVNSLRATEFTAGLDGRGTCHGDSGGPVLQNGLIVGVTSYGDTGDCHNSDHFMRIDDNQAFINSAMSW